MGDRLDAAVNYDLATISAGVPIFLISSPRFSPPALACHLLASPRRVGPVSQSHLSVTGLEGLLKTRPVARRECGKESSEVE